ncbi:MAG: class I SAM-dependent methyltransferase [Candidatus Limnocylindrales bacterium]
MSMDDRFDDLAASLDGFYRTWAVYLGLELGLFRRIRAAAPSGITAAGLATQAGCQADVIETWLRLAHAVDLVDLADDRATMDEHTAQVLLDDQRPEYLGGQFVSTVVSSLDHEALVEFARSGRPLQIRPPRYHRAIEALTAQDIAVFFQEGLAALPDLAAELAGGGRVLDVHCGGGKWLIAVAAQFPETNLVGVELEPDSLARAVRHVQESGFSSRISIEGRAGEDLPWPGAFDLVYFQDAIHDVLDPVASLRAAWACVRTGGRLVVLDWCLPETLEESRSVHGAMMWGIQLDQLFQGTRLWDHAGFANLFIEAGIGAPGIVDLPSGATIFIAQRD